jgi:ribose transport system ATP-binding protein
MSPKVLILDEPTRGIDVGAKGEIQALVDELAGQGLAVMLISSELEEVVEGADQVVVLKEGRGGGRAARGRRDGGPARRGAVAWLT